TTSLPLMTTVPPPTGTSSVRAITVPITASWGAGPSSAFPQAPSPTAAAPAAPAAPIIRPPLIPHPHAPPAPMHGSSHVHDRAHSTGARQLLQTVVRLVRNRKSPRTTRMTCTGTTRRRSWTPRPAPVRGPVPASGHRPAGGSTRGGRRSAPGALRAGAGGARDRAPGPPAVQAENTEPHRGGPGQGEPGGQEEREGHRQPEQRGPGRRGRHRKRPLLPARCGRRHLQTQRPLAD